MKLNGKKINYHEFMESVENLSRQGFRFKRMPSHDINIIVFQVSRVDDILNTKDLVIEECGQLNRLFSSVPLMT